MSNISFQGNYITSVNILKRNSFYIFKPHTVSVVEVDTLNKRDISALRNIENSWAEPFSDMISDDAQMFTKHSENNLFHRFFVLTNQKDNFHNLKPDEILATTEICAYPTSKKINIDALQVNPNHKYHAKHRNYKNIGSAFLDAIKLIFKNKAITVQPTPSAFPFYIKNKFHPIYKNSKNLLFLEV